MANQRRDPEQRPLPEALLEAARREDSPLGRLKIFVGAAPGVGKTYEMLQSAHARLKAGVDVVVGLVETHGRAETEALLRGLEVVPRKRIEYKDQIVEEMDLDAVIARRPEIALVDELAHTNTAGSRHPKRYLDVEELLSRGIDVYTAVNIQHIESLYEEIRDITGIEVSERIPDSVLEEADEVVNIDLTADELVTRLKEGKIYAADKIVIALQNFFQPEKILQLRELALKEVASQVERKIETELPRGAHLPNERFLACIGSNHQTAKKVIRKTARLASYYHSRWWLLYVQTPKEDGDKIGLAAQRHLINNFKMATELGAEVIRVRQNNIAKGIMEIAESHAITTICIGKPHLSLYNVIMSTAVFNQLLNKLAASDIDIVILS